MPGDLSTNSEKCVAFQQLKNYFDHWNKNLLIATYSRGFSIDVNWIMVIS
jgi:hypothetical protein